MKFKVNNLVKVCDSGKQYSTYDKFFDEFYPQWKNAYAGWLKSNQVVKVLAGRKHPTKNDFLYVVENPETSKICLIGEEGIEAVLPRICYVLGGEDTPIELGEKFNISGCKGKDYYIGSENSCGCTGSTSSSLWYDIITAINHPEKIIRNPRLTFTEDEKALMRLHVGAGYPWFARDDNDSLYAYKDKPQLENGVFHIAGNTELLNEFFPQITFENSPFNAAEYLEGLKND